MDELRIFFACAALGGCVCIVYSLTHFAAKRAVYVALCDAVFCAAAFLIVWGGLLFIWYGQLRWYCAAGMAAGFAVCRRTVGFYVDITLARLYNLLVRKLFSKGGKCTDNKEPVPGRTEK